ncbi:MAG: cytochrome d ubiquinol oxidase subunit II [Methylococcales bacterium]|nr:cytochrome d ubiquinol oxidase subunit II [Methylococcales bacterium]
MEHHVSEWLINSWSVILTLILTIYVALDGFDLGIGVLSLLEKDKSRQVLMMESLSGVWDANETWLVLMGGTLFGAFPLAYAEILQAFYIPVLLILFGLIFRGVAFEFRLYARQQEGWILAFGIGSLVAALAQGMALGGLLGGMPLAGSGTPVSLFIWVTPLAVLSAVLLVTVYVLLGASYLLCKVEGGFLQTAYRWAWRALLLLFLLLPVFLLYSAQVMPYVAERWSDQFLWFAVLAFCITVSLVMLVLSLRRRDNNKPFIWCLVSLVLVVIGLAASHYPFLIPGTMTLHNAASSTKTLEFMLIAIGGLLPLMLGYNAYQYYVFRGRTRSEHAASN